MPPPPPKLQPVGHPDPDDFGLARLVLALIPPGILDPDAFGQAALGAPPVDIGAVLVEILGEIRLIRRTLSRGFGLPPDTV